MNILYISYDGMTDPLGQAQVTPYLVELTKKHNHRFHLISFEKKENYAKHKLRIAKLLDDNKIIWHPKTYTKNPPVLSTLLDLYSMYRESVITIKKHKIDIVHCRSYISALIGEMVKNSLGVKFVFDMRGFWADERIDGNIWKLSSPIFSKIYHFFKQKEKDFLKNADHVISLTLNAKNEIHSWETFENIPIQVIPCCVNTNEFSSSKINLQLAEDTKKEFNINPNDEIISYVGSLGTWYLLDEMLDFYKTYLELYPNAKFFFITPDDRDLIINKAKEKNIAIEKIFIRKATRDEIPSLVSICKLSIFFIKQAYSKKASSPTKQGELMSMGIPIICNALVGDTDFIVKKYQSGIVIEDFNKESYIKAILEFKAKQFDYQHLHEGAEQYFSLEKGVEKYNEAYQLCYK